MNIEDNLTFFVWSDTHFGYNPQLGSSNHRWGIVQQMARLPGEPYPPEVGSCVDTPSLIIHCGDFVNGGGEGEDVLARYLHCIKQIDVPSFETLGNHDEVYPNVVEWFVQRYGGKYYSFNQKGIHFICLYQTFDENEKVQALDDEQLQWLEKDISQTSKRVVIFAHDRLDNLPNAEELDSVLSKVNVVLMFSGHSHLQLKKSVSYYKWKERTGIITGHCRNYWNHQIDPPSGRIIMVARITDKKVVCVPRRWDLGKWTQHYEEK